MAEFFANYSMLVINSFGLQNAMERCPIDIPHFFARVHSSAKTCAILVREELGPSDFLKYAPDSHFVFTSYAVLSLLKVSSGGSTTGTRLMHNSCFALNSRHHEITNTRRSIWSKVSRRRSIRVLQDQRIHLRCIAYSCVHCWLRRLSHLVRQQAILATTML